MKMPTCPIALRTHRPLHARRCAWLLAALIVLPGLASGQAAAVQEDLPLFEMDGVEVVYSDTRFAPEYSAAVPTFSYYDAPTLPRGELILALEFMDRYRESPVPGAVKWAGILHFPLLDGFERPHIKWLCLYFYDDRMFGYDPSARYEYERRFAVPIPYEDRLKPAVLLQFAESYVESVFPEGFDEVYIEESFDPDDPDGDFCGGGEYYDIPAGRIAPVFSSQQGLQPKDLVRLIYQYSEDPNPRPDADPVMGSGPRAPRAPFSWKALWQEIGTAPDHFETARLLVAPRWGQKVVFHYSSRPFFFMRKAATQEALLFNINTRVFAYHPQFGVWRTDATVHDLAEVDTFYAKLRFPGISQIDRVEFKFD
jgi:hypothetical protein